MSFGSEMVVAISPIQSLCLSPTYCINKETPGGLKNFTEHRVDVLLYPVGKT